MYTFYYDFVVVLERLKEQPFTIIQRLIQMADKLKMIPDYQYLEADLLDMLKEEFPDQNVRVYRFGSRVNGLSGRESDVDIYVDIGYSFHVMEEDDVITPNVRNKLEKIASGMERRNSHWDRIVLLTNSKVPIIKVRHRGTYLDCDIGVNNSIGVINNNLLEYLFNEQPICE